MKIINNTYTVTKNITLYGHWSKKATTSNPSPYPSPSNPSPYPSPSNPSPYPSPSNPYNYCGFCRNDSDCVRDYTCSGRCTDDGSGHSYDCCISVKNSVQYSCN